MARGLDLGATTFVVAERKDGRAIFRAEQACYLTLAAGARTEALLQQAGIRAVEWNSRLLVLGEDATKVAMLQGAAEDVQHPVPTGRLVPGQPGDEGVVRVLLAALLGKPETRGEPVAVTLPSPLREGDPGVDHHARILVSCLETAGYRPILLPRALAVLLSEAAPARGDAGPPEFTGLALHFGAAGLSAALAVRGTLCCHFGLARPGRVLDAEVARASGYPLSKVTWRRERKLAFPGDGQPDPVLDAIREGYTRGLREMATALAAEIAAAGREIDGPVDIVLGGGGAAVSGLVAHVRSVFRAEGLPVGVREIRASAQPARAAANGALIAALAAAGIRADAADRTPDEVSAAGGRLEEKAEAWRAQHAAVVAAPDPVPVATVPAAVPVGVGRSEAEPGVEWREDRREATAVDRFEGIADLGVDRIADEADDEEVVHVAKDGASAAGRGPDRKPAAGRPAHPLDLDLGAGPGPRPPVPVPAPAAPLPGRRAGDTDVLEPLDVARLIGPKGAKPGTPGSPPPPRPGAMPPVRPGGAPPPGPRPAGPPPGPAARPPIPAKPPLPAPPAPAGRPTTGGISKAGAPGLSDPMASPLRLRPGTLPLRPGGAGPAPLSAPLGPPAAAGAAPPPARGTGEIAALAMRIRELEARERERQEIVAKAARQEKLSRREIRNVDIPDKFKRFFEKMVADGASDLFVSAAARAALRVDGRVKFISADMASPEFVRGMVQALLGAPAEEVFLKRREMDVAIQLPGVGRFRCNLFHQKGELGSVFRHIRENVPSYEELNLPAKQLMKLSRLQRGLVLVTGVAGSGKSTTLASMIEHINQTMNRHIVTIEDPIEFIYQEKMAVIDQREVGLDTASFSRALKSAVRQSPDVILVGEMRDRDTMEAAISAAETGHLVFSTLHTVNAQQTVERIISYFPPHQHELIRLQLSMVLAGVMSLRLLPKREGGGRVPAVEIMLSSPTIKEMLFEGRTRELYKAISEDTYYGNQTFNESLKGLYQSGIISLEEAMAAADNPEELKLAIRGISRGTKSGDMDLQF